jgi:hypothetical protein
MTDPIEPVYGLGAIRSPIDPRDWAIDLLYATAGVDPVVALPVSYLAPMPYPPVFNQGLSPQCVAYSSASAKAYQDLRDTGLFAPDFSTFFAQIGGTQAGAVPRVALQQELDHGYPPVSGSAALHRISAYYSVPVTAAAIQGAVLSFGPVLLSLPWFNSWFRPVAGVLPAPDTVAGGHEILCIGWSATGLVLVNSWGTGWGASGRVTMPWSYLDRVWEAWKSVDVIDVKPRTYTLHIAANATVVSYLLDGSCLGHTKTRKWGPKASSAPCAAPRVRLGCHSGRATVVHVPKGAFAGREVRLGRGVQVTWR